MTNESQQLRSYAIAPSAPTVPPTLNAAHFAVASTVSEVSVSVGHSRMMIHTDETETHIRKVVEWSATLTMSPTTAQTLHTILGQILIDYVTANGPIPEDKETTSRVIGVSRRSPAGGGLQ